MATKNEVINSINRDRKNQITLAALKVFCEKGYGGATVNDIVKKAKCSHGLFYHYFTSKKQIFEAVTEIRGKHIMAFLDQVLLEQTPFIEKLYKLTEYTFQNIKNDEIFAYRYYFFLSTIFNKAESGELPPKDKISPHQRMTAFFEEGINRKEFSDKYPAAECAKLYNSIIQGTTLSFILCPKEFKRNFKFPMIEFIVDVFKKENS